MKKILVVLLFFFLTKNSFSQDVIVLKDGTKIEAKVLEISSTTIKYKLFTQPDGPLRSLQTYEITEIIYEDGQYDTFNVSAPTTVAGRPAGVRPPRPPKPVKDPFLSRGFFIDVMAGYSFYKHKQVFNGPFTGGGPFPYYEYAGRSNFMLGLRIGTKWYLTKKERWRPGIQVNWMRLGIHVGGQGPENAIAGPRTISVLNLGMTNIFKFDEKRGLELNGIFGPMLSLDFIDDRSTFCLAGNLEVKYRKKNTAFGLDYQYGFDMLSSSYGIRWHIISATIGRKF